MALPLGWPPRPATNHRSIRFYTGGTATADFADNAYLFYDYPSANTYTPSPIVPPGSLTPVSFGDGTQGGTPAIGPDNGDPLNKPMIWANTMMIFNDGGADLEVSFDGVNVHDKVTTGDKVHACRNRHEAGIAVRGLGAKFRVVAW